MTTTDASDRYKYGSPTLCVGRPVRSFVRSLLGAEVQPTLDPSAETI